VKSSEFDYCLPPELIAQQPPPERTAARMMVVDRRAGTFGDHGVNDLPSFLRAGDLLVMNETRVIPARLFGRRPDTGGKVEVLLVEEREPGLWEAMYRAAGRPRAGLELLFDGVGAARIDGMEPAGRVLLRFPPGTPVWDLIEAHGAVPLPPYIRREARSAAYAGDRERYQTVYARHPGAIAAPTAGLHFTQALLDVLAQRGVARAAVTLHVGPGTFRSVACEDVENHAMESERYAVGEDAARLINGLDRAHGRVVAVGTTTVRACESAARATGRVEAGEGRTSLFIRPPFDFRVTDALLTNFHLPRSTLLMLVSAFAGRDLILEAYRAAVDRRYRFYSYGDCMLIV
jgi:S-adenosylmethionine:tRNA ribosyltransferase-isomerase